MTMIPYVQQRVPKRRGPDSVWVANKSRFVDYVLAAMERWFQGLLGVYWYRMNTELDMGIVKSR